MIAENLPSALPSPGKPSGYSAGTDRMESFPPHESEPPGPAPIVPTPEAGTIRPEDCWAKTDENGQPCLSVRDHCVNVGAVAEMIGGGFPSKILLPENAASLVAAHDIGKITPGFLMKCPAWRAKWQRSLGLDSPDIYEGNHAKTGQRFLASLNEFDGSPPAWLISVGGHHGKYSAVSARGQKVFEDDAVWVKEFKEELLAEICGVFGALPKAPVEKSARLHWFTGFMVFCDWIGSNTGWFPAGGMDRPTSVGIARKQAKGALADIGWQRHEVASGMTFGGMFATSSGKLMEMRPLQSALVGAAGSQGLFIVEAPMGEGKTEAALAAAFCRWSEGSETGLYFALPIRSQHSRSRSPMRGCCSRGEKADLPSIRRGKPSGLKCK